MLDTSFQRIPGDVGNPETFDYPVRYKIVEDATATRIVNIERPDDALASRFIDAARELEAQGAIGLISTCGFLSVLQNEVARAVSIPVMLSSLSLIPLLQLSYGYKSVGVITADETQLSDQALSAVGVEPQSVFIGGMRSSRIFKDFIFNSSGHPPDKHGLGADLLGIAKKLRDTNPDISVMVLECTNLQPYAPALHEQLKLPVAGIINAANFLWEISQPQRFD